jgi:hypothetical protein
VRAGEDNGSSFGADWGEISEGNEVFDCRNYSAGADKQPMTCPVTGSVLSAHKIGKMQIAVKIAEIVGSREKSAKS